jgi:hypothetical protein
MSIVLLTLDFMVVGALAIAVVYVGMQEFGL